jgi:hypothetical protein
MHRRPLGVPAMIWFGGLVLLGAFAAYPYVSAPRPDSGAVQINVHLPGAGTNGQVQTFCSSCHAYPPEDCLPRAAWKDEIDRAYRFFAESGLNRAAPPKEQVLRYYEDGAPLELPAAPFDQASTPAPVVFEKHPAAALPGTVAPAVSHVNLVHLFDDQRLDVLACDMHRGQVLVYRPYQPSPAWQILAHVPSPAHAEVVDLDGDGIKDILVANLGSPTPTDDRCGSVVWLRGKHDGSFAPHTLLANVGRVADVQAGDFRHNGKLDLVVACFGMHHTGDIRFLENQTTDWSRPKFVARTLDGRPGSIHVPVADLDGDGNLDIIALISQEHETIVTFLGDGRGNFTPKTLFAGPHPAYGSSGIQLVDVNGDGKVDILYTNGDSFDKPHILRPYHGVQWLENQGNLNFRHHPITPLYGAQRAIAADFRGTGRMDIVAVSYLPAAFFPQRQEKQLDAVIYLEQTAPGQFVRHSLETSACDHVTCAAGDIYGRGRIDFVTGHFSPSESGPAVTVWKNPRRAE